MWLKFNFWGKTQHRGLTPLLRFDFKKKDLTPKARRLPAE